VLQAGVFGRPCAVRGAAGRVVRVVMVLDAAVGSRVLLRRGAASANVKTAPHRVLRETCGGGRTRAAPRAHELGQGGGRGFSRLVTCARRRDAVVRAPPSRRRERARQRRRLPPRVLRETCGGGRTRAAPRVHELGQGGGRGCSRLVTCARRRDAVVRAPPSRRRERARQRVRPCNRTSWASTALSSDGV
jgi:hypothetical protein